MKTWRDNPNIWASGMQAEMAAKREASVVGQVGIHFQQTVNVRIRKPRWMPEWAYRRLMRTVVIEEGPLRTMRR